MFESRRSYQWDVPAPMREAGVDYWRTVALAWTMPWFVMAIRWLEEDALQNFLISNDRDVLSALQSIGGRGTLEFLACCHPEFEDTGIRWSMTSILEIWLGGELPHHSVHAVFIDSEHRSLAGPSFESVPGIARSHLIARVGDIVQSQTQENQSSDVPGA